MGRFRVGMLCLTLAVFAATCVACYHKHALYQYRVYFWHDLKFSAGTTYRISMGQAATLAGDLGSLTLAFVSIASSWLYGKLFGHTPRIWEELTTSRALKEFNVASPIIKRSKDILDKPVQLFVRISLIAACGGLAVTFYFLANAKIYPSDWWAHLDLSSCFREACRGQRLTLFAAFGWTFVGFMGFLTATLQMWAFIRLLSLLTRLRHESQKDYPGVAFMHIDRWQKDSHGLDSLWFLMRLKVAGALLFVPTLFALYMLFILHQFTVVILVMIAGLTFIVTVRQFGILNEIPSIFEDATDRRISLERLNRQSLIASGTASTYSVEVHNAEIQRLEKDRDSERRGTLLFGGRLVTGLTLATAVSAVVLPVTVGK